MFFQSRIRMNSCCRGMIVCSVMHVRLIAAALLERESERAREEKGMRGLPQLYMQMLSWLLPERHGN